MAKYPVAGNSYIEVDDSGGTPRNLSAYVEEVGPLGQEGSFLDVTGLNDTAQRVISGVGPGQELVMRGAPLMIPPPPGLMGFSQGLWARLAR